MVRGHNLAHCLHCGTGWVVGDCIPSTCPDCMEKGHGDGFTTGCPICRQVFERIRLRVEQRGDVSMPAAVVVHLAPPDWSWRTACCDRPVFELPAADLVVTDTARVTCGRAGR